MDSTTHSRTQFQIDRIAFFSDAVIAIAITLLVLEIKIPPLGKHTTWQQISAQYGHTLLVHIVALVVCFATIGNLWLRHHELYEHIINYNKKLVKINLYFLLTIILLPLAISFSLEQDNPPQLRTFLLFFNLFLCNFIFYLMLYVIFHKKNSFSAVTSKQEIAYQKTIALIYSCLLLLVSLLALADIDWFYAPFFLMPFIRWMFKRRLSVRKQIH